MVIMAGAAGDDGAGYLLYFRVVEIDEFNLWMLRKEAQQLNGRCLIVHRITILDMCGLAS